MNTLEMLLDELEYHIPEQALISSTISKASVGWHIEHTLLTFNLIIEALKESNPRDYKWEFSFRKMFVLVFNKILRGRAQAPIEVQPVVDFTIVTLRDHLRLAKENLKVIHNLKSDNYFEHPFFGKVNLKPAIKFIGIHTRHHLDIINDIVKQQQPQT